MRESKKTPLRIPAKTVKIGTVHASNERPLFFIAGPCALESEKLVDAVASRLQSAFKAQGAGFVFKCSYDKANRTSLKSYRGIGLREGLKLLGEIKRRLGVTLLVDVHEPGHAEIVAETADILQVPAFLCRQTDLLLACARTRRAVNIKKGQFLSPWEMSQAVEKVESTGNHNILLTERGTTFGYNNLVVDMRSFEVMKRLGYPVIFDCTHAVQLPGGLGQATGGQREFILPLARAATAVGIAGVFFETHPDPDHALSDGPNAVPLSDVPAFIEELQSLDKTVKRLPDVKRRRQVRG